MIDSPLFLILVIRRQSLATVFLRSSGLHKKLLFGLGLAVLSVCTFLVLRGELAKLPDLLRLALQPKKLGNFPAIFLEGVALAFLFVRMRWVLRLWPALLIPACLFALAHVPGQVQEGRGLVEMAAFFVVNTGLVGWILYVVQRSQDVIWIGVVHYFMDIAIGAV